MEPDEQEESIKIKTYVWNNRCVFCYVSLSFLIFILFFSFLPYCPGSYFQYYVDWKWWEIHLRIMIDFSYHAVTRSPLFFLRNASGVR